MIYMCIDTENEEITLSSAEDAKHIERYNGFVIALLLIICFFRNTCYFLIWKMILRVALMLMLLLDCDFS